MKIFFDTDIIFFQSFAEFWIIMTKKYSSKNKDEDFNRKHEEFAKKLFLYIRYNFVAIEIRSFLSRISKFEESYRLPYYFL